MRHHDERYLDAIDRALDGEVVDGIEAGTHQTIDRLRVLATVNVERIAWRNGMRTTPWMSAAGATRGTRRSTRIREPRFSLVASFAIVLAIVFLASFVIVRSDNSHENHPNIAAVSSPSALSMQCDIDERNEPYPSTYVAGSVITAERYRRSPWTTGELFNIDVVDQSALPQGEQVNESTYNGVFEAIVARMACRNAGLSPWNDYVLLDPANTWPEIPIVPNVPELPGTLAWFGEREVPNVLQMDDLGDGNVGVMFAGDFFDYQIGQYDVYRQIDGVWSLVDSAFYADDGTIDNMGFADIPTTGQYVMWDIYLSPNVVYMAANQPGTLTIVNSASESYIFRIPELDVWLYLESGDSTTVEINAQPGAYAVEMLQPGVTTPKSSRQLRLMPPERPATPVS
jgi:hypothetical protein